MSGSSNMNSLIRRAARRGGYALALEPDHPGDIGIGQLAVHAVDHCAELPRVDE